MEYPRHWAAWRPTLTTRSLKLWVGLAVSFLTQTSRRPRRWASRGARTSGVRPALSPCVGSLGRTREQVAVAPEVERALGDALAGDRLDEARFGHIRPRTGRNSTRTRTPRSARSDARIPYNADRWHSHRIPRYCRSSHLPSYSDLSNKKTPFAGFCERRSDYDRWLPHLPGDIPVGIGTWRDALVAAASKGQIPPPL